MRDRRRITLTIAADWHAVAREAAKEDDMSVAALARHALVTTLQKRMGAQARAKLGKTTTTKEQQT